MSPASRNRVSALSGNRREPRRDMGKQPARTPRKGVPGAKKIVHAHLPGFSRQLAAMLSAGMPIVTALEALEEQTDNPNFKKVVAHVRQSIENGAALSEALSQFPDVFNHLYCNMIRGGERGGQLPETIGRLSSFLEASARLRRKVKSALMYPTIVLCIALAIATLMIIFIVPVFCGMFADFDAELPGPTAVLMQISAFMRGNALLVFVGLAIAIVLFKKWKASPNGGYQWDTLVLRAPVFGELTKKVASARFARTFGQLIRSGVPILSSLEIVSGATGSLVAGKVIIGARDAVEKGEPLSSALIEQSVFPILLVRMLQAGEKTGKVDEMMDNIADFYDDEVETMLTGMTSLLEPLLMVFLGILIGGIVLCMFLPVFKMAEVVTSM